MASTLIVILPFQLGLPRGSNQRSPVMSPVPDSLERWMAPFVVLFTRPTWRAAR